MQDVRKSRCHAFAKGTNSNLRTQFRSYFAFCIYFQRRDLPTDLNTLCGHVQFLSRTLKPPSIRNYLSGVKMLHILLGYEYTFTGDFHLQLTLRGIARLNPHIPHRARPVTPSILEKFYHFMDKDSHLHWTVYACSLLLFFTMARLGSILPNSNIQDKKWFLNRDCINFSEEGMLVTLLHTKTIQFGQRRLHIPIIRNNSNLCPVAAYSKSLEFADTHSKFAFAIPGSKSDVLVGLSKSMFITIFRDVMTLAGDEDTMGFTGHSLRRGGASWAFKVGIPGELIQVCGDWSSDAYKKYLEFSMSNKVELAEVFSGSVASHTT